MWLQASFRPASCAADTVCAGTSAVPASGSLSRHAFWAARRHKRRPGSRGPRSLLRRGVGPGLQQPGLMGKRLTAHLGFGPGSGSRRPADGPVHRQPVRKRWRSQAVNAPSREGGCARPELCAGSDWPCRPPIRPGGGPNLARAGASGGVSFLVAAQGTAAEASQVGAASERRAASPVRAAGGERTRPDRAGLGDVTASRAAPVSPTAGRRCAAPHPRATAATARPAGPRPGRPPPPGRCRLDAATSRWMFPDAHVRLRQDRRQQTARQAAPALHPLTAPRPLVMGLRCADASGRGEATGTSIDRMVVTDRNGSARTMPGAGQRAPGSVTKSMSCSTEVSSGVSRSV